MLQTFYIRTDNEKAIEAFKALANELGMKFSPYEYDEDEDDEADIAEAEARKGEPTYTLAEVKQILAEDAERIEKKVINAA